MQDALKPKGTLLLSLKEGHGEGFETHEKYHGTQRWFSYATEEEVA